GWCARITPRAWYACSRRPSITMPRALARRKRRSQTRSPTIRLRHGEGDERIARDDARELGFAPALGAGGTHRHDDVAHVGVRIVHAQRDVLGDDSAEFAEHRARLAYHAPAVVLALVPGGRHAKERARIAGAERAHDDVVHFRR